MTIDKRLLLASLTVAALTFAPTAPSSASAAVWKDNGTNVTHFIEIGLSGGELFETTEGNGMSCEIHATLTTEGGSTGTITQFVTNECPTGFGAFAECAVVTSEAQGLPWKVDVNKTDLTITGWHTRRTFNAGCATAELNKTISSVTATLDSTSAITEIEFVGKISGYAAFGSFTVDAPNSGTYGIG